MKNRIYLYILLILLGLAGCNKSEGDILPDIIPSPENPEGIPEGYFIATFSGFSSFTRTPVNGSDNRVQHLRYILYKSSGEFLKERVILSQSTAATWPIASVKDTLPKGNYKVVFLANADKSLFPYTAPGNTTPSYDEVFSNYKTNYASARIYLPNTEFSTNTEYYMAQADFSDLNPTPVILLQRIISLINVHRNVIDAQTALNTLVQNIVNQVGYKNIIRTTTQGLLRTKLGAIGSLADNLINPIIDTLINPVTDALYQLLLKQLVNQIGLALAGNEDQSGLLAVLGALLNPWESNEAHTAIVTINNFPKSIGFDLAVKEFYTNSHTFRFDFTTSDVFTQKSINIKGFSGLFDIRRINVIKQGLVGGLLVDRVIDSPLLLDGTFIDINDPLTYTPGTNFRYKADYSLVDVGLKDYTQQTDGNHSLTLTLKLADVANIDNLLGKIPLIGLIALPLIKAITIDVPLNLPLLSVDNLTVSGGWSTPVKY